jgi:tetratricopeptide (TPR) repeat protein
LPRAVAVGITRYPADTINNQKHRNPSPGVADYVANLEFADHDAKLFAGLLQSPATRARTVEVITDGGLFRVESAITGLIAGAQPGETVYVFMSVRGYSDVGWKDGFIGNKSLNLHKPESTGISVLRLKELLKLTRAEVILVLDVCREPANPRNRINQRIQDELGGLSCAGVMLASEVKSHSRVSEKLELNGERGFGVFAHQFVSELMTPSAAARQPLSTRITMLFEAVQKRVTALTGNQQRPVMLSRLTGGACVARNPASLGPVFEKLRFSLAAASGGPFAPAMQSVQAAAPEQTWLPPFASTAVRIEPEEAVKRFRQLTADQRHDQEQVAVWREGLAAKLADQGQDIVTRYGAGDQFPDAPDKLQRTDFEFGERCFRSALELFTHAEPGWERLRRMMEARREFCRGRALAFDRLTLPQAREVLTKARAIEQPAIPEIDNALGISYLEFRTSARDLEGAIQYFKVAKERSPGWAYPRHNLALAYIESGNYRAAEREYRDAIEAMPNYPFLYYNMGLLLHRQNRLRQADDYYRQALRVSAEQVSGHRTLQRHWADQQLKAEANLAGGRAAALERNSAEVHNSLGSLQAAMNPKSNKAVVNFEAALKLKPQLYPARHNLALFLSRRPGGEAEAIRLLELNTNDAPDFHPSQVELGKMYEARGRPADAEVCFRRALHTTEKESPDGKQTINAAMRIRLSRVLVSRNKTEEAERLLNEAVAYVSGEQSDMRARRTGQSSPLLSELFAVLADVYAATNDERECTMRLRALQAAAPFGDRKSLAERKRGAANCR